MTERKSGRASDAEAAEATERETWEDEESKEQSGGEESRGGEDPFRNAEEHSRGRGDPFHGGGDPNANEEESDDQGGRTAPPSSSSSNVRRPTAFQATHALKFGLEVVARDTSVSPPRVTAALCLFCKHFGREPKAGAKRRATTNFKYFKGVFRTDQYLQHHRLQHPTKWAEYDAASVREKQTFFPRYLMTAAVDDAEAGGDDAFSKTRAKKARRGASDASVDGSDKAQRVVGREERSTQFEIPSHLAGLLMGDGGWEPTSLQRCVRAPAASEHRDRLMVGASERDKDANSVLQVYRGALPDRLSFDMAVDLCASGLDSTLATQTLHAMAHHVPNGTALASVWTDLVDNYAQVATLGSLTVLSTLLASHWAFSIGLHRHDDAGNVVDVRVRLMHTDLHDFHLCCIRVDEAKENLEKVLYAVCPDWTHKLLGISVAGDVIVSNALSSTVQWLHSSSTAKDTMWVTWNGNDLVRRAFLQLFHELQGGSFAKTFHSLKVYIKSQARLLQEIGHESQAPNGIDGDESVEDIVTTARWFSEKRVRIRKYFQEECEGTTSRPRESWWLCLAIFDWIATSTSHVFESIAVQCGRVVPAQQLALLEELSKDISTAFRVSGVEHLVDPSGNTVKYLSWDGAYAATKTGVLEFIVELGSFVNSVLTSLHHDDLDVTLESLGTSIANFVETLQAGQHYGREFVQFCQQDERTGMATSITATPPAVLPHDFVKLSGKDVSGMLRPYRQQLLRQFSEEELDALEQEHTALKRAVREKSSRGWTSDAPVDRIARFDDVWGKTMGRFRLLQAFAGGVATVLPRAASRLPRGSATAIGSHSATPLDLAVEAPLHATQFHKLERLWLSVSQVADYPPNPSFE